MKKTLYSLCLSLIFPFCLTAQNTPKVVVGIVVDQLRSDYIEKFTDLYGEEGFKRLWKEGLVYPNGSYDFTSPDRSSATASVYSGTEPCYHGIVGNRYLERKTLRAKSCVDDDVAQGIRTADRTAPSKLLVTTIADELKIATKGSSQVYSVAAERDMAVLAGGHAADAVLWINDADGQWASSTFYKNVPNWLSSFNRRPGSQFDFKSIKWTPYFPSGMYKYSVSEDAPKDFCHTFNEKNARRYKTSAIVNDEVTEVAKTCLMSTSFGRDNAPDMLCIGYYAGNYDHQSEQYSSFELQDIYCRLDRNIAAIIRTVSERVGLENAVIFLTSTGYTDIHEPAIGKFALPTGEVRVERCTTLLNMYLGALYGTDNYVEGAFRNEIFLNHKLIEDKQLKMREVLGRCSEFLGQMSGVKRAYVSAELVAETGTNAYSNAYNDEYSGDIRLEIAPGWAVVDERWGEKIWTSRAHIPTPVIFFGGGIKANYDTTPISVDVIAPTISSLLKITSPNACAAQPLGQLTK